MTMAYIDTSTFDAKLTCEIRESDANWHLFYDFSKSTTMNKDRALRQHDWTNSLTK